MILKEVEQASMVKQCNQEKKSVKKDLLQAQCRQYRSVFETKILAYKEQAEALKGEIDILRNDEAKINAQLKE